jgi:carbon storage regulator
MENPFERIWLMLVLSRKVGEKIVIDNDIVVTIVRIQGDKVRIGIEAPANVPVHRQEIVERAKAQLHSDALPFATT